ncbi:hypothetical protein LC612_34540 [Nostoc sp. CHAB 5834]|nr:hypothetical protein [Nostoc sp. CHAB 5834]
MAGDVHERFRKELESRGIEVDNLGTEPPTPAGKRFQMSCIGVLVVIGAIVIVAFFAAPNRTTNDPVTQASANQQITDDETSLMTEIDDNEALIMCQYHAEASAKFEYEWESMFGIPDKKGIDRKVTTGGDVTVTVYGGGLKLQNGFGAWSRHTFICEVSSKSKSVTGFQIF